MPGKAQRSSTHLLGDPQHVSFSTSWRPNLCIHETEIVIPVPHRPPHPSLWEDNAMTWLWAPVSASTGQSVVGRLGERCSSFRDISINTSTSSGGKRLKWMECLACQIKAHL